MDYLINEMKLLCANGRNPSQKWIFMFITTIQDAQLRVELPHGILLLNKFFAKLPKFGQLQL